MEEQHKTHQEYRQKADASDGLTTTSRQVDAGYILLHKHVAGQVEFTDVYRALRRHETGETQPGIPESLCELAESDSRQTGLHVSYHVGTAHLVFGIVTAPRIKQTFVRLAPLEDLAQLVIANNEG